MTNLVSAKDAIRAEIAHAKKGAAYYQSLVVALEQALAKLDSVGSEPAESKALAGRSVTGNGMERPRRGRKPGSKNKVSALPSTAKEFWPSLITDEPQSASDILNAAIAKLNITPSDEQRKKLAQRATFALNHMVKTNTIADSGSGRARRFMRKQ